MNRTRFVTAALLIFWTATVSAEIPNMSKEQLRERASHIVTGEVKAIYTQERRGDDWHHSKGVVEISVSKIEKGIKIEPGDSIYARFWTQRWIGKGNPPPFGSGHQVPKPEEEVRVHLDRKDGGFDALLPNGFELLQKEKSKPRSRG